MHHRLALVVLAALLLAGCGHTRPAQTNTVTQTVTTPVTQTVTETVPRAAAPAPATTSGTTRPPAPTRTPAPAPAPARKLVVGAVEDEAKFAPTDAAARADMQRARRAGLRAIAF